MPHRPSDGRNLSAVVALNTRTCADLSISCRLSKQHDEEAKGDSKKEKQMMRARDRERGWEKERGEV
jgi:hypothetical protein